MASSLCFEKGRDETARRPKIAGPEHHYFEYLLWAMYLPITCVTDTQDKKTYFPVLRTNHREQRSYF